MVFTMPFLFIRNIYYTTRLKHRSILKRLVRVFITRLNTIIQEYNTTYAGSAVSGYTPARSWDCYHTKDTVFPKVNLWMLVCRQCIR